MTILFCKDCKHCLSTEIDAHNQKMKVDKDKWRCNKAPQTDILDGSVTYLLCSTVRTAIAVMIKGNQKLACGVNGDWFEKNA